jgi:hypothetical protein
MIRGTTPTITMKLPSNVPVGDIDTAVVSIQQVGRKDKIEKHLNPEKGLYEIEKDDENGKNLLMVKLSQEDTLSLFAQKATNLQLKVKLNNGTVSATYPMPLAVVDIINEEVI